MEYKKAQPQDSFFIANLHKVGIPTGFLSKQSSSFLEALYAYLIEHEIVYVAKERNKVVGFIAVSTNTSGLYKRFLKSNFMLLARFSLKNIFSFEFVEKALETLLAPKKTKINTIKTKRSAIITISNSTTALNLLFSIELRLLLFLFFVKDYPNFLPSITFSNYKYTLLIQRHVLLISL